MRKMNKQIVYDKNGIRVSAMPESGGGASRYVDVAEGPNTLAAALCQVVLAIGGRDDD